jgi:hypothetical protein
MPNHPRLVVEINDADGRRLAGADIEVVGPSTARASLHVESGHVPMGIRPRLVDAVLDERNVVSCTHLLVVVPLGDTEILDRVRQRCRVIDTHPAGVTCLMGVDQTHHHTATGRTESVPGERRA